MAYNPNDMIAYMPAAGTPFWLAAVTLSSMTTFFVTDFLFFLQQHRLFFGCQNLLIDISLINQI